ncbi:hypothetical protein DFJ74DRAFT_712891 [Hyaloraphidium curvatum]|nr:hypothetical protein DFJ74DRAFT_712891 [Hyaloraphidium curvatum]
MPWPRWPRLLAALTLAVLALPLTPLPWRLGVRDPPAVELPAGYALRDAGEAELGKAFLRRAPARLRVDETTCEGFDLIDQAARAAKDGAGGVARSRRRRAAVAVADYHGATHNVGMFREMHEIVVRAAEDLPIGEAPAAGPFLTGTRLGRRPLHEPVYLTCPPRAARREVFGAFSAAKFVRRADVLFFSVPAALVQHFMALNRSMVLWSVTPPDHGRQNVASFRRFRSDLRRAAASPRVTIVAGNAYNARYLEHYYGVRPAAVISLYGSYRSAPPSLRPAGKPKLGLFPKWSWTRFPWAAPIAASLANHSSLAVRFDVEVADPVRIGSYAALVHLPYTHNTNLLQEAWAAGVPIFAPTLDMLVALDQERCLMSNRIYWAHVPEPCRPRFPYGAAETQYHLWPSVKDPPAHRYWLAPSSFYDAADLPHVSHYPSFDALPGMLLDADLAGIAAAMRAAAPARERRIREAWRRVFARALRHVPDAPEPPAVPGSLEEGMRALWGDDMSGPGYEAEEKVPCDRFARGVPERGTCDEWLPFPF